MRMAVTALLLALCACGKEQTFDERYAHSENEIEQRARELDKRLDDSKAIATPAKSGVSANQTH